MKRIQALSVVLMLAVSLVLTESANLSRIQASIEKTTARGDSGLDILTVAYGTKEGRSTLTATLTVNSTADTPDAAPGNGICADSSGNCTLRAAIEEANALAGLDTIQFNIGTGTPAITPSSELPQITQPVIIDGNSGGATRVELNGASAGALATGLTITGGASTVRNMVINRFGQNGIVLMTNGSNKLEGNFIGTDATGTVDLGNFAHGVIIVVCSNNSVGSTTAGTGNVISGNGSRGLFITSSSGNTVEGNFIGTDFTGTVDLGNSTEGMSISHGTNNRVGGTTAGARNVISGNNADGVLIFGSDTTSNKVEGNYIGTDVAGLVDLGNSGDGILVNGVAGNIIGGVTSASRNILSGNNDDGIEIRDAGGVGTLVQGNFIGTDVSGSIAIRNTNRGIRIQQASNNTIGGTSGAGNLISGNGSAGIDLVGGGSTGNVIQGNFIGTQADGVTALPNASSGVLTSLLGGGPSNNVIGGANNGEGNVIAFNDDRGILISVGTGNAIRSNSIFSNSSLGIDLWPTANGPAGITLNDPCDPDTGANNLQNFPSITSATASGGSTTISGSLDSNPGTQFTIEFFSSSAPDPSGFGEGQTFLGSTTVTTSGAGDVPACTATFTVNLPVAVPLGFTITATATNNSTNDTSEFSEGGIVVSPTDADITEFSATALDGGTLVEWQTGLEVDNLGFNLYREIDGQRTLINDRLLAGSALLVGPGTALTAGRSYALQDSFKGSKQAAQYWLEDLDLNGRSTFHGPVAVTRSADPAGPSKRDKGYAPILSSLGRSDRQQHLTRPVQAVAAIPETTAAQRELHSALASRPALKLSVLEEGWHRVSFQQLVEAGLDPKADARFLQLFVEGRELPMSISADDDSNAFLEFYGVGMDSPYTDKRTYWLVEGSEPGKRIESREARGEPTLKQSFTYTVERRDRTIYFSALKNQERENFFGAVVASEPVDQTITIHHLDKSSIEEAIIEVAMQGVTRLPHQVKVLLNAEVIGEVRFEGQAQGVAKLSIAQSLLKEGDNTVRLIAEGGNTDVSLVDYIRISYSHSYRADDDALRLTLQSNQQVKISGFSNGKIRVIDVTDADSVAEMIGAVEASEGSYSITVAATGEGQRRLLAFTDRTSTQAVEIIANQPSNLRTKKQKADLLILAHHSLLAAVEPLKALREAEGLKVIVVDLEDVYDEFSYGQKTPVAIREFLLFTRTNWKKAPRFVLLVGDASLDPRNYLGKGDSDLVPTRLIDTELMETASDDWFADFDSDGLAEMALGRLPARTSEEAVRVISKIVNYDRSPAAESVLLVSDSNDGFDFEAASKALRALVPAGLRVEEIGRSGDEAATANSRLIESLNRGQRIVSYTGHGSVEVWRGNLLRSEEASKLTNGARLPVFISMTCLNGYFQDAALDSLAESLMKAERGGAVAVWASSGMTGPAEQARMSKELFRHIFAARPVTLGEAVTKAKAAVSDSDIRRTWILFGDPTMKLKQ